MNIKKFLLLSLILSLIVFIIACSNINSEPLELDSQQSIKEIIRSKGKDYNFLDDKAYIDNMDKFIKSLNPENNKSQINYEIGNLDDDNIPEFTIFIGKDPQVEEDEGRLELYKFNGDRYVILDSVSMNFDLSNYQMKIGNVSEKEKGILLNNNVGKKSGITYGFKLKDNKLKSILNSKKMNLVSIFTKNEIKDINNDGTLEFSIYTVDPETEDITAYGSDKMTIWYKWNGKDSGDIVETKRKDLSKLQSDSDIYDELEGSIDQNFSDFISFISENKEKLSNYDNTKLLNSYIDKLESQSYDRSINIENLFKAHQEEEHANHIFDKYGIDIDNLNSLEYLNREKVLRNEVEIKEDLIESINLGYKLNRQKDKYYYLIDYKKLFDLCEGNITREYSDYLQILALGSEQQLLNEENISISNDNLVDRILMLESFKMIYPFSDLYNEVDDIYKSYLYSYLYGDNNNSKYNIDTGKLKDESLKEFEDKSSRYPHTNFGDILEGFIKSLEENSFIIDNTIRKKVDNRLN